MEDCVFCKIIKGEIPSTKIYEDENVLAFKDINPAAPIHILVVPKQHIENVLEINEENKEIADNLVKKIDDMSNDIDDKNENSPARLNIDRVFSVKGFGTVVTGTLLEGKISIDDDLVIYPNNLNTKIRSIQAHGQSAETPYAAPRTAINISNIKVEELKRGDVLAAPNSLEESMMLDVKLSLVKHTNKNLKHWDD